MNHLFFLLILLLSPVLNAQSCSYDMNADNTWISGAGGKITVSVLVHSNGCNWTISSDASWISFNTSGSSSSATITVTAQPNPNSQERTAVISAAGKQITITQGSPLCSYTTSKSSLRFPNTGGTQTLNVTTGPGCPWSVHKFLDWVGVTSSGIGSATVTVVMGPTSSVQTQGTTIFINDQPVSVTIDPIACSYNLGPQQIGAPATSTSAQISVLVSALQAGCTWKTSTSASWIKPEATQGSGSATININLDSNPGAPRSGTLTVAGKTALIYQAGAKGNPAGCSFSFDRNNFSVSGSGEYVKVGVRATPGCYWKAVSNSSWLYLQYGAGIGDGSLLVNVPHLTSGGDRSGQLIVEGQTLTINQLSTLQTSPPSAPTNLRKK